MFILLYAILTRDDHSSMFWTMLDNFIFCSMFEFTTVFLVELKALAFKVVNIEYMGLKRECSRRRYANSTELFTSEFQNINLLLQGLITSFSLHQLTEKRNVSFYGG